MLRRLSAVPWRRTAATCCPASQRLSTSQQQVGDAPPDACHRELLDYFPVVAEDVMKAFDVSVDASLSRRVQQMLEHTVPGGRLVRARATLDACSLLAPDRGRDPAKRLAWAVELLHASYLVTDDICDGATTRRGRPCWHTLPNVGAGAFLDAVLLERAAHALLQLHFQSEPAYLRLVELFGDTTLNTTIGQMIDAKFGGVEMFDAFSLERWAAQARAKTSFYTFYTPTAAAMYLANITDPDLHAVVWSFAADIGAVFSLQDDLLDAFEAEESTGKSGTDIANGKCTWLVVEAKRRADARQLAELKENYGSSDAGKVAAVRALYDTLGVRQAALAEQTEALGHLQYRVYLQDAVPPAVLRRVLDPVLERALK